MKHLIEFGSRTIRAIATAVALGLCIATIVSANNKPPVRIGLSLGLTGMHAATTDMQRKGFWLWEQHVNRRGGILGRRVELIIKDDKSDPAEARRIYEELILRDKVDFVFGPYSAPITRAIAPLVENNGYPMLVTGASADDIWQQGHRNMFGISPPASRFVFGFLSVLSEANIKRVAMLQIGGPNVIAEGANRWVAEYGVTLTSFQDLNKNADLDAALRVARQSGAEALLVAGYFEDSVNVRRALKRIGWQPAAYYASIGPALDKYGEVLGEDANGTFSTSTWEAREDLNFPGAPDFLRDFTAAYREKPSYHAANVYGSGLILEQAILKAGSVNRAAVREALARLDTTIMTGRYAVDQAGIQTKRHSLIIQWQKGRREIVWPQEIRTAPPVLNR